MTIAEASVSAQAPIDIRANTINVPAQSRAAAGAALCIGDGAGKRTRGCVRSSNSETSHRDGDPPSEVRAILQLQLRRSVTLAELIDRDDCFADNIQAQGLRSAHLTPTPPECTTQHREDTLLRVPGNCAAAHISVGLCVMNASILESLKPIQITSCCVQWQGGRRYQGISSQSTTLEPSIRRPLPARGAVSPGNNLTAVEVCQTTPALCIYIPSLTPPAARICRSYLRFLTRPRAVSHETDGRQSHQGMPCASMRVLDELHDTRIEIVNSITADSHSIDGISFSARK